MTELNKIELEEGLKVIVTDSLKLPHTELKWGKPTCRIKELHKGQFILDKINSKGVKISDAEWDLSATILFHSVKHGHYINKQKFIELVKKEKILLWE